VYGASLLEDSSVAVLLRAMHDVLNLKAAILGTRRCLVHVDDLTRTVIQWIHGRLPVRY